MMQTNRAFYDLTGIPGVVGCIDCTHVKVDVCDERKPSFMNRKGYTSNNKKTVRSSRQKQKTAWQQRAIGSDARRRPLASYACVNNTR